MSNLTYEVVRYVIHRHVPSGRSASIYGASPWNSERERQEWVLEEAGWTLQNPLTGQVGVGRAPCATYEEACALALKFGRPSAIGIGD